MNYSETFKIEPSGEREIVMTRIFNATPTSSSTP